MDEQTSRIGWRISLFITAALAVALVTLWSGYECCGPKVDAPAHNAEQVALVIADSARENHVHIPTGIYVQSLAFKNSHDVEMTGRIWQRIPAGVTLPDGASPGVIFPDAITKHADNLDVIYEDVILEDGARLTVWNFQVTLRQFFAYNDYPLDGKLVWIRFWSQDIENRVMLVPDLAAYTSTLPDTIFGISDSLVAGEWQVRSSFFGYAQTLYDTDFGRNTGMAGNVLAPQPELRFHVILQRNFTDAFVINLVPLFVTYGLLFGLLMSITRNPEQAGRMGFDTLAVFGSCAGLFFIVMLGHIQLRESFAGSQIVYLEYFYIASYIAVLTVSLISFLLVHADDTRGGTFLRNDGRLIKQIYWPVLLAVLVAITIWQLVFVGPQF